MLFWLRPSFAPKSVAQKKTPGVIFPQDITTERHTMNLRKVITANVLFISLLGPSFGESDRHSASPPKVIIDTDFNTMSDDGQVGVMAAQLYAQGVINLLGFTIPSGNQWRDQGVSDCLKAVERLGIEHRVKVYLGAQYPLLHDYSSYLYEQILFGPPINYVGAYSEPQPDPNNLVPPPDGFATHTRPAKKDAVRFIIDTVHRYPHEVTILAIGPFTNVALAMREDPTIVPLIKQIVIMGGQMFATGNAYNNAGEFNWWFDPEAAQVVLRANVPKAIVPLDATNTVPLPESVYLQITQRQPPTIITQLYIDEKFNRPGNTIFDTVAFAYFVNPSLATDVRDLWVDMNTNFDKSYGQSIVYQFNPFPSINPPLLNQSKVVFHINNDQFFAFYADLLTRPVPVHFRQNDHDDVSQNED
jgi:inosine-uridine nucleoside N-ribohydrolase